MNPECSFSADIEVDTDTSCIYSNYFYVDLW